MAPAKQKRRKSKSTGAAVPASQKLAQVREEIDMDLDGDMLRMSEITAEREAADEQESAHNIKVSVRVRPLNSRERTMGAQVVTYVRDEHSNEIAITGHVSNSANSSTHQSTKEKVNHFVFDHVFDSSSPAREDGVKHADQRFVFEHIGLEICEAAWHGFNASLFAYGQTGSGKTYTMSGSRGDLGVVPRICEMIFHLIKHTGSVKTTEDVICEVTASYLEICTFAPAQPSIRTFIPSFLSAIHPSIHPSIHLPTLFLRLVLSGIPSIEPCLTLPPLPNPKPTTPFMCASFLQITKSAAICFGPIAAS